MPVSSTASGNGGVEASVSTNLTTSTRGNPVGSYGSHDNRHRSAAPPEEQNGSQSPPKSKTLTWITAAVVIFAFAMGSGVTSAGYLVSSTGVVFSPVLLILTAFFSFAGARLLLLVCEQHPNSVVDLGDAGRVVGGPWLELLGRGAQFLNFFLYLPVALDLCGDALAGLVPEAFPWVSFGWWQREQRRAEIP